MFVEGEGQAGCKQNQNGIQHFCKRQFASRGGGANRMLVEEGANKWLVEGEGQQDVSRGGGANRMLVESEGQAGC